MSRPQVDVVVPADDEVGEGPVWDPASGRLLWVDILRNRVHASTLDGTRTTINTEPHCVTAVVPTPDPDTWAVVTSKGFGLLWADGRLEVHASVSLPAGARMNDGKCAPDGSFWAGSMVEGAGSGDSASESGALFRWLGGSQVEPLVEGLQLSNGLGWAPEGDRFYLVDTGRNLLTAYSLDERGRPTNPTPLFELDRSVGVLDGLTVDDSGFLWVAVCFGSQILRISRDGEVVQRLTVPVSQPTSLCFGGSDMRTLFITTARAGLDPDQLEEQPAAGSILAVELPITGPAAGSFRASPLHPAKEDEPPVDQIT